jgi:putative Mg2+ transporter-C (MgtC) family protein
MHWRNLLDLLIAYLLAFPVGWERERDERSAGLRTFTLVSLACCAFVLTSKIAFQDTAAQSRTLQGLIGGIGFIGAGTIIKYAGAVHGTATAAGLLVTAIIGVSVAFHAYDIAAVLSFASLFTLRTFQSWKDKYSPPDKEPGDQA